MICGKGTEHVDLTNGAKMTGFLNNGVERRTLLGWLGAGALACQVTPVWAATGPKSLSFRNIHTGEALSCTYWDATGYRGDALADIDRILRDHRTGDVALMDLGLLDLLHAVKSDMDSDAAFDVISGYRSPKTNEMLRQRGAGVNENSLHMTGRAIDVRLPGRDTARLRDIAIAKRAGGVGFYAESDFVHIDVGVIQTW